MLFYCVFLAFPAEYETFTHSQVSSHAIYVLYFMTKVATKLNNLSKMITIIQMSIQSHLLFNKNNIKIRLNCAL